MLTHCNLQNDFNDSNESFDDENYLNNNSSDEALADEEEERRHFCVWDKERLFLEEIESVGVGNLYPKFKFGDVSEETALQEDGELEFDDPDFDLFVDIDDDPKHIFSSYEGDSSLNSGPSREHVIINIDEDGDLND